MSSNTEDEQSDMKCEIDAVLQSEINSEQHSIQDIKMEAAERSDSDSKCDVIKLDILDIEEEIQPELIQFPKIENEQEYDTQDIKMEAAECNDSDSIFDDIKLDEVDIKDGIQWHEIQISNIENESQVADVITCSENMVTAEPVTAKHRTDLPNDTQSATHGSSDQCCNTSTTGTSSDCGRITSSRKELLEDKLVQKNLSAYEIVQLDHKPFKCHVCSKSFLYKSSLKKHVTLHYFAKSYSCDLCCKSFLHKAELKGHLIVHSGLKPFSCTFCKKAFSQKSQLQEHLNVHSGVKPFSCDICSKSFSSISDLNKHSIIHSGLKTVSGDVCKKSISQNSHLQAASHVVTDLNFLFDVFPCPL